MKIAYPTLYFLPINKTTILYNGDDMFLILDQSSNATGYAIFDNTEKLIDYGIIDLDKLPKSTQQDQTNKRDVLIKQIDEMVKKYKIKQIVTEGVYFHKNPDTLEKLAKVQGCIQDYCFRKNIVCFSFANAGEWRKRLGITAKKRDEYKKETKAYVLDKLLNLSDSYKDDIYDAVAIGLAYFTYFK